VELTPASAQIAAIRCSQLSGTALAKDLRAKRAVALGTCPGAASRQVQHRAEKTRGLTKMSGRLIFRFFRMLKRLSALLFILAIAGQAFGGVCECLNRRAAAPKHSCCKKSKVPAASFSAKGCCETDCGPIANTGVVRSSSENSTLNVAPKHTSEVAAQIVWLPRSVAAASPTRPASPSIDKRHRFARPPDLFRLHHSFLI
jgi:hypothetical protein